MDQFQHGMAVIEPNVWLHYVEAGGGPRTMVLVHGYVHGDACEPRTAKGGGASFPGYPTAFPSSSSWNGVPAPCA